MSIHKNYLLLTEAEKKFVDEMFREAFHSNNLFIVSREQRVKIPLDNSDGVERAVEAIATWVIESRPMTNQEELSALSGGMDSAPWIPRDGESPYDPKTEE